MGKMAVGIGDSPELLAREGNFGVGTWSKVFVNNYLSANMLPFSLKKAVWGAPMTPQTIAICEIRSLKILC